MTLITSSDMTRDTRLENASILYTAPNAHWKNIVGAPLKAKSRRTWYPTFDLYAEAFKDFDKLEKIGDSAPPEIKFPYTTNEVTIQPYHNSTFIEELDMEEAMNEGIDALVDASNGIQDILNLKMNKQLCTLMTTTGNWSSNDAVTAVWTDKTNGNPEKDIRAAARTIQTKSRGIFRPNTMVMGQRAFDEMMTCDRIRDIFKYNLSDMKGAVNAIKSFFEIDRVFVVPTAENTAKIGKTASLSDVWTTSAWIGYIEPSPARNRPSALYALALDGKTGNDFGIRVSQSIKMGTSMFDDKRKGAMVVMEMFTNFKVIAPDLGFVLTGIYT